MWGKDDPSQRKKSWLRGVELASEAWNKLGVDLGCGSCRQLENFLCFLPVVPQALEQQRQRGMVE